MHKIFLSSASQAFISCWVRINSIDVGKAFYIFPYNAANNAYPTLMAIYGTGEVRIYYASTNTVVVAAGGIVSTNWNHFAMEVNKNGTSYYYVNGAMVGKFTAYDKDITALWFAGSNSAMSMDVDVDALYCGDSWLKMWSNFYDGQVADRARWTRYGERGWHYCSFLDNDAYHTIQKTTIGSAICVIRAKDASEVSDAGGILAVGAVAKSTPNAKALLVRSQCNTTVANTATEVRIYQYGKSSRVQSYTIRPVPVANYNSESQGITELNSNTDFEVYINNGAGSLTTSCYLMILGYMI
jgi:hypothetical protein